MAKNLRGSSLLQVASFEYKAFVIFILKFDENERILELLADLVNRLVGFCIDGMDIFRQESSARSKSR